MNNSNSISNSERKENSKSSQIRHLSSPQTVSDVRITRSSGVRPFTPPPQVNVSPSKTVHRRRPDTPLPEFLKSPARPITRSVATIHSPSRNEDQAADSYEKPTTRSSKSLDNGFLSPALFRRSNSNPPMRPSSEPEKKESLVVTRSKKSSDIGIANININSSTPKRRPDTPVPTAEQLARVTRSGLNFTTNSGKSSSNPPIIILRGNRNIKKSDGCDVKPQDQPSAISTDTNGNVAPENIQKQEESTVPLFIEERPQRTAKVVAILTLDTRSNFTNKSSPGHNKTSNCNTVDGKAKKSVDTDGLSEGKNCIGRTNEGSQNYKIDGWSGSGLDNNPRDRMSTAVFSNVASTYTNSNKGNRNSTVGNKNTGTALSPKTKGEKVPLPVQSAVIALVDLDNDSKRLRRKIKRTRLTQFGKSLAGSKTDSQTSLVDGIDDDEEQIPPNKKSVRSQLPPSPSQAAVQLDKISSGTVS